MRSTKNGSRSGENCRFDAYGLTESKQVFYPEIKDWILMSSEKEMGPDIIEAHQELVRRIEQGAGRMRTLAALSVIVAGFLTISYLAQLALPLTGTTTQTVDLTSPALVTTEVVVLGLALVWLYVGISDLRFSLRIKEEIYSARAGEKEIGKRIS